MSERYVIRITEQRQDSNGTTLVGRTGYYSSEHRWTPVSLSKAKLMTFKDARWTADKLKSIGYVVEIESNDSLA